MKLMSSPAGAAVFGVAVWQLVVWISGVPHFILPGPWRVVQVAVDSRALLAEHALVTALEVFLGLLIGSVLGGLTAIQLAFLPGHARLVMPLLIFTQAVPVFALAPLLTLWLGYGLASKTAMAVLIIFFPVTSSFFDGLMQVPPAFLDLAKTMGASRWQVMRRIKIPHALPSLASGLKLAAVYAPIGAVIGEWVGASRGLGYLMLLANGRAKTDLMFASLIVLAGLTVVLHKSVSLLAEYLNEKSELGRVSH
ncbi:ABC transporter permease [Ruegeria atlantica]|uniref:ABC transporter permease n=1 Tax=Ruegeria atlantica TaxID=81569 RepID=UPI00147CD29D|nr:ABC transporter permease [Ruegeria atlantica]